MAFPREILTQASTAEKFLDFDLYLPGVSGVFRTTQFAMEDLKGDY
jgi:hypothetical protein